jgi:hypothetical protein
MKMASERGSASCSVMAFEQPAQRLPAGDLVAVLQDGDEQRPFLLAGQGNQGGAVQLLVQCGCRPLQQPVGQVIEFCEFRRRHVAATIPHSVRAKKEQP